MDYRRASQVAQWLLVALVVGLHLALFLWPETPGQPLLLLAAAHDAQLLAGVVLILAFGVLGPGKWWLRLAILPVLLVLWALPWNGRIIPREPSNNLPNLVAISAALAIVATRLFGFRVQRLDPTAGPERGAQFSLLGLLIATTLIAAAIGGLEALRPILSQDRGGRDGGLEVLFRDLSARERTAAPNSIFVRKFVMALAVALSGIGGLWVVMRPGAAWFRLGALAIAIPVLAVYLTRLAGITDETVTTALSLGLGFALVAAFTGLTLWPLRVLEFRLQRRPKAAASGAPLANRRLADSAIPLAVAGLLLVAGWPLMPRLERMASARLQPPSQGFAEWIEPRLRHRVYLSRLRTIKSLRLSLRVRPEQSRAINLGGQEWEYRAYVEARQAVGQAAATETSDQD
jgi:hypothetical protein